MIIMLFVGIALIVFASTLSWTSTNAQDHSRDNLFNQAESAAESATELPLAAIIRDFVSQNLNSSDFIPAQCAGYEWLADPISV